MKKALEEIQKLIDENYPCDNTEQKIGYQYALNKVYNLLSLMELHKEEEPWVDIFKVLRDRKKQNVSEDLEEEIREWVYNPMLELTDKQERGEEPITTYISEFEDTARHFANWQKEQMMTDEEMKCALRMEYEKGVFDTKQQLLKDAKDGYVSAVIIHNDGDEEHYAVTYPNGERPHIIADKVKIIILKQEEDKK